MASGLVPRPTSLRGDVCALYGIVSGGSRSKSSASTLGTHHAVRSAFSALRKVISRSRARRAGRPAQRVGAPGRRRQQHTRATPVRRNYARPYSATSKCASPCQRPSSTSRRHLDLSDSPLPASLRARIHRAAPNPTNNDSPQVAVAQWMHEMTRGTIVRHLDEPGLQRYLKDVGLCAPRVAEAAMDACRHRLVSQVARHLTSRAVDLDLSALGRQTAHGALASRPWRARRHHLVAACGAVLFRRVRGDAGGGAQWRGLRRGERPSSVGGHRQKIAAEVWVQ